MFYWFQLILKIQKSIDAEIELNIPKTCQDSSTGKAWNCNRRGIKVLGFQVQFLLELAEFILL